MESKLISIVPPHSRLPGSALDVLTLFHSVIDYKAQTEPGSFFPCWLWSVFCHSQRRVTRTDPKGGTGKGVDLRNPFSQAHWFTLPSCGVEDVKHGENPEQVFVLINVISACVFSISSVCRVILRDIKGGGQTGLRLFIHSQKRSHSTSTCSKAQSGNPSR